MPKPSRILLIEDNEVHTKWVRLQLKHAAPDGFLLDCATTLSDGIEHLEKGGVELVLLDMGLPDCDGLPSLNILVERFPTLPIVILSALEDELVCTEAVRQGAQDYFFKGHVDGDQLVRGMRYAVARKQIEEELKKERRMLSDLNGLLARQQAHTAGLQREVNALLSELGRPPKYSIKDS